MSVRKSLAWAYSGQVASFLVTFAGSVAVARLLSPHELGIYAIAMAAQGLVQIFVSFGVGAYIIREPDLQPRTLDTAFTVNAGLSILLSALLLAASFGGSVLLGDAAAGNVLKVSAIGPLLGLIGFRPSVMLQREMRFKAISMIGVIGGLVSTVSTVLLAWLGASYMSPAIGGLLSGVVGAAIYVGLAGQHISFRLSSEGWRPMTSFGLRMMSIGGVAQLASRSSELVLGRLLGVTALGLYSRAANLSNMIWSNVYGTATQVIFVQMSREFRETGELHQTFVRSLQIITAFMWPILLGLAILARPAIHILYGDKWLPAAAPLSLLMTMQFVSLIYGMNWELFVLRDETRTQSRIEITRSAVGLAVFTIGCFFSLTGAAIGRVVDASLGIAFYYPHMRRLAGTGEGELPRLYVHSLMLTVAAVAPSALLMVYTGWSARTPLPLLVGAIALGIGFWAVLLVRFDHPVVAEFRLVRARVLRPKAAL